MMNLDASRETTFWNAESLIPDVCLSYNLGRPLDVESGAAQRLMDDADLARDARIILLKRHIQRAMSLACRLNVIEEELDFSQVDTVDAAANLLFEAVHALRSGIGTVAAAEVLKAVATCMESQDLSADVLEIVDNVRYGFRPFGSR